MVADWDGTPLEFTFPRRAHNPILRNATWHRLPFIPFNHPRAKTGQAFEMLLEIIKRVLEEGEDVLIGGFGTSYRVFQLLPLVAHQAIRTGVQPEADFWPVYPLEPNRRPPWMK
jgi:hypothetical protein